jgi:hypothetical protein
VDAWVEQIALFIAYHRDGEQWADNCPEWVRERYREAARLAWRHVLGRTPGASLSGAALTGGDK